MGRLSDRAIEAPGSCVSALYVILEFAPPKNTAYDDIHRYDKAYVSSQWGLIHFVMCSAICMSKFLSMIFRCVHHIPMRGVVRRSVRHAFFYAEI